MYAIGRPGGSEDGECDGQRAGAWSSSPPLSAPARRTRSVPPQARHAQRQRAAAAERAAHRARLGARVPQ
eukprot:277506-Prymnesium_polylepis.1